MKQRIDFYYYNAMCPLNIQMLALLQSFRDQLDVHTYDITQQEELAKEQRIFFPTLIVLNQKYRYFSPLTKDFLHKIVQGKIPKEEAYVPKQGRTYREKEIIPITEETYPLASHCVGKSDCMGCKEKMKYLKQQGMEVYGFMNVDHTTLLGGVEYMNSMYVPYDIPKHRRSAFITCVYMTDENYDYKTAPLKKLEQYLRKEYQEIMVITDEYGCFPNGDMKFFLENG